MDSSPPCSSVHRILQARILEWAAISFSLSNRKRVLVNPGAILRETPLSFSVPRGKLSWVPLLPKEALHPVRLALCQASGRQSCTSLFRCCRQSSSRGWGARHAAPPQRGAAGVCRGRRAGGPISGEGLTPLSQRQLQRACLPGPVPPEASPGTTAGRDHCFCQPMLGLAGDAVSLFVLHTMPQKQHFADV